MLEQNKYYYVNNCKEKVHLKIKDMLNFSRVQHINFLLLCNKHIFWPIHVSVESTYFIKNLAS